MTSKQTICVKLGCIDEETPENVVPFLVIDLEIMKRSNVFKDILDPDLPYQELYVGKYFVLNKMQKVFDFIKECHNQGKYHDPYDPVLIKNPRAKDVNHIFDLPQSAKDILIQRDENGKLDHEIIKEYMRIGQYFMFYQVREACIQIIVTETNEKTDGTEEHIFELFGKKGSFVPPEFVKELEKKYPFFQSFD